MRPLSQHVKRVLCLKASTAAETSTGQDGAVVDTAGFNRVEFIGTVASATGANAVLTLSARGADESTGTYQALGGATIATTTGQQDGLLAIELDRPKFRFVRPRFVRATGNSHHGGIIALLSNPKEVPTTDDSTSLLKPLVRVEYAAT